MISYANVIYEYFDPSNSAEFNKLMTLNENDQDRVLVNLASKLYEHIRNEITDVDFGKIPESRGDITKIPNYMDLIDCIQIIHDICVRFKQPTTATDTISKAIQNLKDTKEVWKQSFYTKTALGMNTYNTLALGIVCSVSMLISTSIEFIKDQDSQFNFVLNKVAYQKSLESVLFKSLKEFNNGIADGTFIKAIIAANSAKLNISEMELMSFDEAAMVDSLVRAAKELLPQSITGMAKNIGGKGKVVIATVSSLVLLCAIVLPAIRNAVHWFFFSKQKLSDYFAIQAALLEVNANNVKYNNSKSEKERQDIYNKQMKWVGRFKDISNKLTTVMSKAETVSKNKLEQEANDKITLGDVETSNNVSALF